MKKYLPALVCGFGAGVLQVTPIIKAFSCCLIIPAAAIFSIILDQKANQSLEYVKAQKGIVLGLFTGLFAAFFATLFEVLITYITKSNDFSDNIDQLNELWQTLPQDPVVESFIEMFKAMAETISNTGFSLEYSLFLIANNLFVGIIFGIIGGLIGMKVANTGIDRHNSQN